MDDKNIIVLRRLELTDAKRMLEWLHNPAIYEKMQYDPTKQSIESCREFIKKSWDDMKNVHYAISYKTNEYLGTISLKNIDMKNRNAELGIALHPEAMGMGVGTKALKLMTQKAFVEMGLHKIYLYVRTDNEKAVRFYQRNGWECEGIFKEHFLIGGEYKDLYWFAIKSNIVVDD